MTQPDPVAHASNQVGRKIELPQATRNFIRVMWRFLPKQQLKRVGRGIDLRRLFDAGRA